MELPCIPSISGGSPAQTRREHWIRYEYDLISGKVLQVAMNELRSDRFFHRYGYDEDNRLTKAETSRDGIVWDNDASYTYYAHGPLKKVELGTDKVQTVDYTYTLQVWLKAINQTKDPGVEVIDVFKMKLKYYNGDFTGPVLPGYDQTVSKELFNGNIAAWQSKVGTGAELNQIFGSDLLNRLKVATADGSNPVFGAEPGEEGSTYSYDRNGNLSSLNRWGGGVNGVTDMDKLTYSYENGSNKLSLLTDAVPAANPDAAVIQSMYNDVPYKYDAIGNLTKDREGQSISWNVFGKIKQVTNGNMKDADGILIEKLLFAYDAAGNRNMKKVQYPTGNASKDNSTWYVRDAAVLYFIFQKLFQALALPLKLATL